MPGQKPCEFPSANHSEDRVNVYHGEPEPMVLCGFHASTLGPDTYVKVREARAASYASPLDAVPDEPEYPHPSKDY